MNLPLTFGKTAGGSPVSLPLSTLRRHLLALGASGSGKTVLCKVLVEECIRSGLPVIAVDPQGDLASLALAEDPDKLEVMGVDPKIAAAFHKRVEPVIWTPGASYGVPLSLTPNMQIPEDARPEDRVRAFGAVGQALAGMISDDSETTATAFSMILEYADRWNIACENLSDFAAFLGDPPPPLARELEPIYSKKAREKALQALTVKMKGANRLLFEMGQPIDINELFGLWCPGPLDEGKVRLSIIYLNTLTSQEEKEIFVSLLCSAMYQWMLGQDGTQPMGLLYMDEIAPFIPPVKNPASKRGLMMLLRQARKYGLCLALATQSPGDIDYKALGQIGTMALGRIQGERALSKVEPVLRAEPGVDSESIVRALPGLETGRFFLVNPDHLDEPADFRVRWLVSKHRTVTADGVEELVSDELREKLG